MWILSYSGQRLFFSSFAGGPLELLKLLVLQDILGQGPGSKQLIGSFISFMSLSIRLEVFVCTRI